MDSIRLSPRLQMVADFVPPCACAADIGTDHGYLPVWLLQNGVVQTAIAADIHVGPLANARKSAAAYDSGGARSVRAGGRSAISGRAGSGCHHHCRHGRGNDLCDPDGDTVAAAGKTARFAAAEQSPGTGRTGSGTTVLRSRTQPSAAMPASAILPCACLDSRPGRHHARWSSCCFAAAIRCCRSTSRKRSGGKSAHAPAWRTQSKRRRRNWRRSTRGSSELQTCLKEVQTWQSYQ